MVIYSYISFLLVSATYYPSFSYCSNRGPLARSYDYWISVVNEVAERKSIELLTVLDLQPYFLSVGFDHIHEIVGARKYLHPVLFKEAAIRLNSFAHEWKTTLSSACMKDLKNMVSALLDLAEATIVQCEQRHTDQENLTKCLDNRKNKTQENIWPLQIINAFGIPSAGLFHQGQYLWYGSYHQCRYTVVPTSQQAVYCMVSFGGSLEEMVQPSKDNYEMRMRLKWGTCLPAGCVENDGGSKFLSTLIQSLTNASRINPEWKILQVINRHSIYCQLHNVGGQTMSCGQVAVLIVFTVLVALIVVGTIVDLKSSKWTVRNKVQKMLSSIKLSNISSNLDPAAISAPNNNVSLETPSVYSIAYLPSFDIESVVSYKSQGSLKKCLQKLSWWMKILMAFSVRLNVCWLMQTNHHNCGAGDRGTEKSKRITCIYGIKALTMIWVILGHTYIFTLPHVSNLLYVSNALPRNALTQIVLNASLSVDSFFLISGLLTSYTFYVRMLSNPKKQRLDSVAKWSIFYAHRLFRLLSPYVAILAFVSTWFSSLGDGPQWDPNHIYGVQCNNNDVWWRHLLFVNNLFSVNETSLCLPWMWHIAVDFQLYLVAPFFLVLLWKTPKWGVWITGVVILASAVGRGAIIVYNKLPTNLMLFLPSDHFNNDFRKYFELIYEKPYFRCGPYFVGILTGWCLAVHSAKLKGLRMKVYSKILIWLVISVFCLWPLFGIYPMYGYFYDVVYNAVFAAINRTVWSIGVATIIIMCHSGHSEWMNAALSWTKYWPASRLTYSVYLTHELVIIYVLYTMTTPIEFNSHFTILSFFFMFLAFTYPLAFLNFLLTEAPTVTAERLLFRRKHKRKINKLSADNDNLIDRNLVAKRWVDVIANTTNRDEPPEGWGKSLYDAVPTSRRLKLVDNASTSSGSETDSDDEVMIDPEIDFVVSSNYSPPKEPFGALAVGGVVDVPIYCPLPKLAFNNVSHESSVSPSSIEETPSSCLNSNAYRFLENSGKQSEVDECIDVSLSSAVFESVVNKKENF